MEVNFRELGDAELSQRLRLVCIADLDVEAIIIFSKSHHDVVYSVNFSNNTVLVSPIVGQ